MTSDYGIFTDLVKGAGFLVSATTAISLTWRGRARWEPSEEDIPRAPQKVAGLASAVALAFLWSFDADNSHLPDLKLISIWSIAACIFGLIVYGYLVAVQTYFGPLPPIEPGARETPRAKIIGGFWLLEGPRRLSRRITNPVTIQEQLDNSSHNPDRIWPRQSRGLAKTTFVVFYLLLTVPGTIALTSASMLVIYKNPAPAPIDKKTVQVGIVLSGQIYFTREIMAGFTEELDKILAPSPYSANYEFVIANPDISQESQSKAAIDDLFSKFPSQRPDYLITIGTQASEVAKKFFASRVPIVFVGVTDPVRSGLVNTLSPDQSRGNLAGVIYGLPIKTYLEFFQTSFPGLRFGFVFNKNYPQDVYLRDDIIPTARLLHPPLSVVPIEVSTPELSKEQEQMADIFFGRYYVAANLDSFVRNSSKPFVASDISNITKGAIACIAPDSKALGVMAAQDIIRRNLLDGVPLWQIPISGPTQAQTAVNMSAARKYGISISSQTISHATRRVD